MWPGEYCEADAYIFGYVTRISAAQKSSGITFLALVAIYSATLAPDVTFWDSGEFLAAIHSLGIPHPPGTALYVILANVWAHLFSPILGFARAVNFFSAVCAAAGCSIMAGLFSRWLRDPYVGFAAAICAGATSSLWMSATETEVYAPSFLAAALLLWAANEVSETGELRYLVVLAYLAGLGWALHLTALIALPAALVLGVRGMGNRRMDWRAVSFLKVAAAALIGASAVAFMYFRARHDPAINQGNPSTVTALFDAINRKQYEVVGLWPRRAPLYLQLGNVFEWADWQFALALNPQKPPSLIRTPVTLMYALLGILGCVAHRRAHLPSWRSMMTLFVVASLGVALYLNLRAGPSYAIKLLGAGVQHEARERDYFFILAWVSWGLWAGVGAMYVARKMLKRSTTALPAGLALAAAPVVMNWAAVDRSRSNEASEFAKDILQIPAERAVVLARSDNDTYPVWYLREVMRKRPDIVTITVPMLPTRWYREEIQRRFGLLDGATAEEWKGTEPTIRVICERAAMQSRPVVGPYDPKSQSLPPAC
jgi:hypothetical protein